MNILTKHHGDMLHDLIRHHCPVQPQPLAIVHYEANNCETLDQIPYNSVCKSETLAHLLASTRLEGSSDVQDGLELGRTQRTLSIALTQRPQVEGVAAQEVHRWELERSAGQGTLAALENTGLRSKRYSSISRCLA